MKEKISYSQVDLCVSELQGSFQNIQSTFDEIDGVANSINGSWQGQAADSYIDKIKEITSTFDSICNEMDTATQYLSGCMDRYKKSDNVIGEDISNLKIGSSNKGGL